MNKAVMQLNLVYDFIENDDIKVNEDNIIFKLNLKTGNYIPVGLDEDSVFTMVRKKKLYRIHISEVLLLEEIEPMNGQFFTELDLVELWLNNKLAYSLLIKFYYKEDESIDISIINLLVNRILQKETRINATILSKKYNGLYSFLQKRFNENALPNGTLTEFLIKTLKIPETLVEFNKNNVFIRRGYLWDHAGKKLFSNIFDDFKSNYRIVNEDNTHHVIDGILKNEDKTIGIDFKLSDSTKEQISYSKENIHYKQHFDETYLLFLYGPKEKIQLSNLIQMHVEDFIIEFAQLLKYPTEVENIIVRIKDISQQIDEKSYHIYEKNWLSELLNPIKELLEEGIFQPAQIAEELNLDSKYVSQILNLAFFQNNSVTQEINRLYKNIRKVKELNAHFYAINCLSEKFGPFANYKECIAELNKYDMYSKFCDIQACGIERCLNSRTISYKGYCFVKQGEYGKWELERKSIDLAKAKENLYNECSYLLVFNGDKLVAIYSSMQICSENMCISPNLIATAIENFESINGLHFYRISPRKAAEDEVELYRSNGVNIYHLLGFLIENFSNIINRQNSPTRNMTVNEVTTLLKNILDQLKNGVTSISEIAKQINSYLVEPILRGNLYSNHPLSSKIKKKYHELLDEKNDQSLFYAYDYLGNESGPFQKVKDFVDSVQGDSSDYKYEIPYIRRVLNGQRGSYMGYVFIYKYELPTISKKELNQRILKTKEAYDSEISKYIVQKEINGQIKNIIYDTKKACKENEKLTEIILKKYTNSNLKVRNMKIFKVSLRKYSEEEMKNFIKAGININSLLAVIQDSSDKIA